MASTSSSLGAQFHEELTCGICLELFTKPKILPCQHTVCEHCLKDCYAAIPKYERDSLPCPFCRRKVRVPRQRVEDLPNNHLAARLCEKLKKDQAAQGAAAAYQDDLGILEKDMIAAGISLPTIVRDIQGVPAELHYPKTVESTVGPEGGTVEISGFVKLCVPSGALQSDTKVTVSTADIPGILTGLGSVNWISGYPWSLGEDACPRELLDQVLFSPAVKVNLHGARLSAAVELETWRPPGSEGMECLLLKHHNGKGWTDITAATKFQMYPDKISMSMYTFCSLCVLWTQSVSAVRDTVLAALSSRTIDCWFAAYTKSRSNRMQFHVVCRNRSVQTEEYRQGFKLSGSNRASHTLFHGEEINVAVNAHGSQAQSKQVALRSDQCREPAGQQIQMILYKQDRNPAIGEVIVKKIQRHRWPVVCQLTFEEEGETSDPFEASQSTSDDIRTRSRDGSPSPPAVPKKRPTICMQVLEDHLEDDGAGPSGIQMEARANADDMEETFETVIAATSARWDDLARELGFSPNEINVIRDSMSDHNRRCREMLHRWKNREGKQATLQVLKQALVRIGETLTAENLQEADETHSTSKEAVGTDSTSEDDSE